MYSPFCLCRYLTCGGVQLATAEDCSYLRGKKFYIALQSDIVISNGVLNEAVTMNLTPHRAVFKLSEDVSAKYLLFERSLYTFLFCDKLFSSESSFPYFPCSCSSPSSLFQLFLPSTFLHIREGRDSRQQETNSVGIFNPFQSSVVARSPRWTWEVKWGVKWS